MVTHGEGEVGMGELAKERTGRAEANNTTQARTRKKARTRDMSTEMRMWRVR